MAQKFANPLAEVNDESPRKPRYTEADPELFEMPLQPVGVSGGTAAFFFVKYKPGKEQTHLVNGKPAGSRDFWIGKDFARAQDEVEFYEAALAFQSDPEWDMLKWMTPYGGIVRAPCVTIKDEKSTEAERDILLLRNARDQYSSPRLLDIKVGEVTAVAGWQGKGAFMAWTQKWLDGLTNSAGQGFRLEGFDNPPPSMQSVLDHATIEGKVISDHKLHRFLMQRQPAKEFLKFFVDLHDTTESTYTKDCADAKPQPAQPPLESNLSNLETEELVLLQCIEELAGLVAACRKAPIPQQWIGSSVMLTYDAHRRPSRKDFAGEDLLPLASAAIAEARVHVFDWGRSELNTPQLHNALLPRAARDRERHWGYYCGGVALLLYDCCLVYARRYLIEPKTVVLSSWDRDVYVEDDLVGLTVQRFGSAEKVAKTVELQNLHGDIVKSGFNRSPQPCELTFTLEPIQLPPPTRFAASWQITVHSLKNAPRLDVASDADPVVHIQTYVDAGDLVAQELHSRRTGHHDDAGTARGLLRVCAQSTTVATNETNPIFEERFQLGYLTTASRVPFFKALAVALPNMVQESAKDKEGTQLPTFVAEADRDQSVAGPTPRYEFSDLFPVTIPEGFGSADLDPERLFLRHCFPELAAKGLLIDPSRKQIDTFKEKFVLVSVFSIMCLILILLIWLAEYEFFERHDEGDSASS